MIIAVPDYISNSYFPAIAAVELGLLKRFGVEAEIELRFPVTDAAGALARGEIDLLAGAAHSVMYAEPGRLRLLATLARNTYWFLVVRADLPVRAGRWADLRGLRIGAAPGPDLALHHILRDEGIDLEHAGIEIGPVPAAADADSISFGVTAAEALRTGAIDAFWANGMGTAVAVQRGVGRVVADARRGGEPHSSLTFPALMTNERFLAEHPDVAANAVRAVVAAQDELRADPGVAAELGARLYPPVEAGLIGGLIERDGPYYAPEITAADVAGLSRLGLGGGLIERPLVFGETVAEQMAPLWSPGRGPLAAVGTSTGEDR